MFHLGLIELSLSRIYFSYEDSFYRKKFGMMMEDFETQLLPPITNINWLRYVSDIFRIYQKN